MPAVVPCRRFENACVRASRPGFATALRLNLELPGIGNFKPALA